MTQGADMHTKNGLSKPCSLRLGHTKSFAGMVIGVLGCFSAWGGQVIAHRPSPPLGYTDVVRETRKHENFAVSERPTANKVVFRKVRLNLKPVFDNAARFHVKKKDHINFICSESEVGFNGGDVVATVTSDQGQKKGVHIYRLDRCAAKK